MNLRVIPPVLPPVLTLVLPLVLIGLSGLPAAAADIQLGLPLDCKIGVDCWVQQYVDHDATTGIKDYSCGGETYDGHDGTDFRVLDTSRRVKVLASADGMVTAKRDGVDDRLAKTPADVAAVKNIECGNGVVINHVGGWQTQYCHLRKSTVRVKAGDAVKAGDVLGEVGYSGEAAFPHVHLTVRKNKKPVDPFGGASCSGDQASLWRAQPAYQSGEILKAGFQQARIDLPQLEDGSLVDVNPTRDWPAFIAYVWAINLRAGDEVIVSLQGPGNVASENKMVLEKNKAQLMLFAGKKQPVGGWPAGSYTGKVVVVRDGNEHLSKEWQAEIK